MNTGWVIPVLCLLAFALAVLLAWMAIAYAHRRGMLDAPGRRRSHSIATPRGGGIGVVAGLSVTAVPALLWLPAAFAAPMAATCAAAGLLVAAAGWWDDHRALPVLPRLLVQLLAASLFAVSLGMFSPLPWIWLPVCVLAAVWSINLHNFMDGIDGLLATQAIYVGLALAAVAWSAGQTALAGAALCLAAASAGFALFNWSPARIFMGDVGSGFIGIWICMLSALLCARVGLALWTVLIISSGFVADAGFTLAWRMLRGRRWYTAHREHLYQWLVRRGRTHAQTGRWYMLWNVLLVSPMAGLSMVRPQLGLWACLLVYASAACVWLLARRACLRAARGIRGSRLA